MLQYTNGSPCGKDDRRKSTIISFHCDKDPLATQALATFVGTDPDECSYSFEVLSKTACITAEPAKQSVGPATVFAIIGVIAFLVYLLGGIFYQRTVAHARGWRQLPNYSIWSGIGNFIKVSALTCLQRSRLVPRVASVRDGILPTMEVRPPSLRKSRYMTRSSWESTHLS